MSNPTIEQKKEAIAIYDGWKFINYDSSKMIRKNGYIISISMLDYHRNWATLMPVIEKISKTPLLEFDGTPCKDPQDVCNPITFAMPTADGKRVMFRFKGNQCHEGETLIEAAFEAVYDFIIYENAQKVEQNGK